MAQLAIDPVLDADLVVLKADHLLEGHTTWVGFRRSTALRGRGYMYDFIERLAAHLPRKVVRAIEQLPTQEEVDQFFEHVNLPVRDSKANST